MPISAALVLSVCIFLEDVVQSSEPGVGGTQCAVVVPLVTEKKPCCFQHELTGSVESVVPGLPALSLRWMDSPAPSFGYRVVSFLAQPAQISELEGVL